MARISPKKERTLDVYIDAGAKLQVLKRAYSDAFLALGKILKSNDFHKLYKIDDTIVDLQNIAESNMFNDYPELPDEYTQVFYNLFNLPEVASSEVHDTVAKMAYENLTTMINELR